MSNKYKKNQPFRMVDNREFNVYSLLTLPPEFSVFDSVFGIL